MLQGEPHEVLSSQITKKQRQKPSNQTRLKNLRTGKVFEKAFHQSDTVEEADIEKRTIKHLYTTKGEYWFSDKDNPKDRFSLSEDIISGKEFLKENELVSALMFNDTIIGITLPIKVELTVTEAPPAVRGNTAQGATKQIVLESGARISAPLFIDEGDIIRVNTETGEYAERVEKS